MIKVYENYWFVKAVGECTVNQGHHITVLNASKRYSDIFLFCEFQAIQAYKISHS